MLLKGGRKIKIWKGATRCSWSSRFSSAFYREVVEQNVGDVARHFTPDGDAMALAKDHVTDLRGVFQRAVRVSRHVAFPMPHLFGAQGGRSP